MNCYTRRETIAMLLSVLPSLSLASLAGCTCNGPTSDDSDSKHDDVIRPALDTERLSAALSSALANSPWADKVEPLVTGATAELNALREAGLDDTVDLATYALNGIVANVAAGFGESMAARGSEDYDYTELTAAIISEMTTSCEAMRASLPGATTEISEALGGDTVPGNEDLAQSMLEDEAEVRRLMLERGQSDQVVLNLLLGQLQSARADATNGFSLASTSAQLDTCLSGLAPDEAAFQWSLRKDLRLQSLRPISRTPSPPPDEWSDACDLWSWVSFFVGWMTSIHKAGTATASRMTEAIKDLPDDMDYIRAAFPRWLAAEFSEEAASQTESIVMNAINGVLNDLTSEECDRIAAFLVIVFWFVNFATTILAFAQGIGWAAETMAALTGGLLALVVVLMLLIFLFYCIELMCAVIGILPNVEVMFGECD